MKEPNRAEQQVKTVRSSWPNRVKKNTSKVCRPLAVTITKNRWKTLRRKTTYPCNAPPEVSCPCVLAGQKFLTREWEAHVKKHTKQVDGPALSDFSDDEADSGVPNAQYTYIGGRYCCPYECDEGHWDLKRIRRHMASKHPRSKFPPTFVIQEPGGELLECLRYPLRHRRDDNESPGGSLFPIQSLFCGRCRELPDDAGDTSSAPTEESQTGHSSAICDHCLLFFHCACLTGEERERFEQANAGHFPFLCQGCYDHRYFCCRCNRRVPRRVRERCVIDTCEASFCPRCLAQEGAIEANQKLQPKEGIVYKKSFVCRLHFCGRCAEAQEKPLSCPLLPTSQLALCVICQRGFCHEHAEAERRDGASGSSSMIKCTSCASKEGARKNARMDGRVSKPLRVKNTTAWAEKQGSRPPEAEADPSRKLGLHSLDFIFIRHNRFKKRLFAPQNELLLPEDGPCGCTNQCGHFSCRNAIDRTQCTTEICSVMAAALVMQKLESKLPREMQNTEGSSDPVKKDNPDAGGSQEALVNTGDVNNGLANAASSMENEVDKTPAAGETPVTNTARRSERLSKQRVIQRSPGVSQASFALQSGEPALFIDCGNVPFSRKQQEIAEKRLEVRETGKKGRGVFCLTKVAAGTFLSEYNGEVLYDEDYGKRIEEHQSKELAMQDSLEGANGSTYHWYCMEVTPNACIDSTYYGNYSRLFNHSCDPNCILERWITKDEYRMGIFAKRDVSPGEELTYNYNFQAFDRGFPCHCNAPNCSGLANARSAPPKKISRSTPSQ